MNDLMKMDDVRVERKGFLPQKRTKGVDRPKQHANHFFIIHLIKQSFQIHCKQ
jgi:hypothetical protein